MRHAPKSLILSVLETPGVHYCILRRLSFALEIFHSCHRLSSVHPLYLRLHFCIRHHVPPSPVHTHEIRALSYQINASVVSDCSRRDQCTRAISALSPSPAVNVGVMMSRYGPRLALESYLINVKPVNVYRMFCPLYCRVGILSLCTSGASTRAFNAAKFLVDYWEYCNYFRQGGTVRERVFPAPTKP